MEKLLTIVCCYNNEKQYYDELLMSLEKQNVEHDVIGINNKNHKFNSAAAALNFGGKRVRTPYVIFCHQDISLPNNDDLERFIHYLKNVNIGDIIGVAGAKYDSPNVFTNIVHGLTPVKAGGMQISELTECDTVDECFFGMRTETFQKYSFNEELCNNWHLYAVERCVAAKIRGNHVYVCDLPLIHSSKGKMNNSYNRNFYGISRYYANDINYLWTTCAKAKTDFWNRNLSYVRRTMSILLGRY